ncbi:Panacea domain-containing protein [Peptoniphilus harei]|uniref:DUF4065 domain-containing protein n=1 Tax=Peptoniphilus harei TaxID=54005 RepID=A0A943XWS6_9FIRM|nr:type II toxin-antitoxin system antitoxin SocA domain-containing protein [Peptoniphilus harei]MBS6535861.1 DUF4065 domain-containing protein [Peptoniphilus harei]
MNYEAKEVAKFIVNYANSKGKFVNNTMVNIILYYLQGFSYICYNEPLFQDDFEAWAYGPRIPEVYTLFSMFGLEKIRPYNEVWDLFFYKKVENINYREGFSERIADFLEINVTNLLQYTSQELVASTQKKGTAWEKIYEDGRKNVIPKSVMKNYFISTMKGEQKKCLKSGMTTQIKKIWKKLKKLWRLSIG